MIEQLAEMPTYEAYKDSGVEWLGEIPQNWQVKRIKHVTYKIGSGITPTGGGTSYLESGIPLLRSQNVHFGKIDLTDVAFISSETHEMMRNSKVRKGDVLLNITGGSIGRCHYVESEQELNVNQHVCIVRPKTTISTILLNAILASEVGQGQIWYFQQGGGREGLNFQALKNFFIALPSNEEQTAIADFLDRKTAQIDQAVAIKEQQIVLLKERKQILIQNAVTRGLDPNVTMRDSGVEWIGEIPVHWEVKRLKYVLDERNERSKTGEEPLFMVSQTHGLVVRSEFHEKAEVAQSNVDNKIVYKNDLVFNKLKAHLGVFFKSNIDFKGLVSPDYAVYQSNGLIDDLKYLEHLFRHPAYIGQFIIRATGIVEGLIRLYTGDLFQISIPVPPKHEQKAILVHIETQSTKIDRAIAIQQQQIDKLKEYKATLINSAVTGKIRVPEVVV